MGISLLASFFLLVSSSLICFSVCGLLYFPVYISSFSSISQVYPPSLFPPPKFFFPYHIFLSGSKNCKLTALGWGGCQDIVLEISYCNKTEK